MTDHNHPKIDACTAKPSVFKITDRNDPITDIGQREAYPNAAIYTFTNEVHG